MEQGKCSICSKDAVITIRYMNRNFCQSHFIKMFESRVKRTIRQYKMLKKNDKIAVALSGGKDSTVLLHMMYKMSKLMPIKLFAITIDEGIEGYRNKTLEIAKRECQKLNVPLTIVDFKKEFQTSLDDFLKKKQDQRACSYCGVMRRYLLNKYARILGADKIAVGHNADDIAQTVLMNIMRNEPERLGRFGPEGGVVEDSLFVKRIKPLFTIPEREVAAYAILKGIEIEFVECPYAQTAFRQHIRKVLNELEEKYPGTKQRIIRSFIEQNKLMLDGIKYRLEKRKEKNIEKCQICGEPSAGKICTLCMILERA